MGSLEDGLTEDGTPVALLTTAGRLLVHIAAQPGISAETLGSALGLSPRTVTRGLSALRAAGWVRVEAAGRTQGYVANGRPSLTD